MRTAPPRTHGLKAGVVAAVIACGMAGAAAATLGGVTASGLSAFVFASSTGAPTVLVWENFDGTNGMNMVGSVTDGGAKTWVALGGTWTITANRTITTSAVSGLVVNLAQSDARVEATVYRGGSTWDVGLTANANAGFTQFLTAEWTSNTNGSLELWKYNGSWTSLASVTGLYPGGVGTAPAAITLRLSAVGANLTAYVNGASVVTATLAAADVTTYKNISHPYVGLVAYMDAASTIDNMHVDQ